ncbi:hypothetical protein CDAR_495701 [Caerostris darwini]|uniref:Uncharacterized protein n=1 Tax=Caerostris darwini TaxID=1538125 RepID=A0AAV4T289_9ARAC|nr:hypothetical protein CDAR_495701 [Caerostris darwini]
MRMNNYKIFATQSTPHRSTNSSAPDTGNPSCLQPFYYLMGTHQDIGEPILEDISTDKSANGHLHRVEQRIGGSLTE